jgi:hypothetical protein
MGTDEARKAIRHFATTAVAEDVKDNLKGAALSANWPANFPFSELTPVLTRPRSANHSGSYEAFLVKLANGLTKSLPKEDVLVLMRWAEQDWLAGHQNTFFDAIVDRIMVAAWEGIEDAAIRQTFVASLLKRLRNHLTGFPWRRGLDSENKWPGRFSQNIDGRNLLLRETILAVEYSPYLLRSVCSTLFVAPADAELFLDMARNGDEALRQKIGLIFFAMGREDEAVLTAVYQGIQEGVLDAELSAGLSVDLGSDAARELQEDFGRAERQAFARQKAIEEKRRILNLLLDRSEGGEPDAWFRIWDLILVADWADAHGWGGASRLDQLSCWVYLDDPTRERLYQAAQRALLNGTRPPLDFLGQSGWPSWASAEFAALLNTIERSPSGVLGVEDDVWQRWSTLAVWYGFTGTDERARDLRAFLAQRLLPFVAAAEQVLNLYIPEGRCSSIVDGLHFDWVPEFALFMLEQTSRTDLGDSCWNTLVALGFAEARQLFEEYLWEEFARLCVRSGEGRDERLITIVTLLLRNAKPGTWTALRDLIFAEPSIAQAAVGRAGTYPEETTGWNKWEMAKLLNCISG